MAKEAKARVKINKLLEESGWLLLDSPKSKANLILENHVKITRESFDALTDGSCGKIRMVVRWIPFIGSSWNKL